MKLLTAMALSLSLLASESAHAQTITIARSGSQPSRQGPAENFTGSVRVEAPFGPNAHLAFYSGWPNAITAVGVATEVFENK